MNNNLNLLLNRQNNIIIFITFFIFLLLFYNSAIYAQTKHIINPNDIGEIASTPPSPEYFSNLKLGLSKEEIMAIERKKNTSVLIDFKDNIHIYNTFDFSIGKCQDFYFFDKDVKTCCVLINIINYKHYKYLSEKNKIKSTNIQNNILNDYNKVSEALDKIYGKPNDRTITTFDSNNISNLTTFAYSFNSGRTYCKEYWDKGNYTVTHVLASIFPTDNMSKEIKKEINFDPLSHFVLVELKDLNQ